MMSDDPLSVYKVLMSARTIDGVSEQKALEYIEALIDVSFDARETEGLVRGIDWAKRLRERNLNSGQSALLHYFTANAWENLRRLRRQTPESRWEWDQEEVEHEIFHYRSSLREKGLSELEPERELQVLTNLGNLLGNGGRFSEAIEYWDRVLAKSHLFGMAHGNRGAFLCDYARALYDRGHQVIFFKYAHAELKTALSLELYDDARKHFDELRAEIESKVPHQWLEEETNLNGRSVGRSRAEKRYRGWCLENRLFLNPLNDLGPYQIAARDVLGTPAIVVAISEGPYYQGYFNQMKQEFVSARYIYCEGINLGRLHFSDRNVTLFNTLDYPAYSLAVEKVKAAFRITYSMFDKVAYFLNHYLGLSIPERQVSFRTIWYESQNKKRGLRDYFEHRDNWPLRGLFWLSKDLYEDKPGFRESIEPDAQEIVNIRNHLEHKYLKLHDSLWSGRHSNDKEIDRALSDTLAFSLYRCDFEAKTLRLLKMARAALIYLSLAIHREEQRRASERGPDAKIGLMPSSLIEDEWKV